MRNISCMHTVQQIMDGTKTETRRLGWKKLKAGDLLQTVVKGQGLKKGETAQKLRVIRVDYSWREPLRRLTDNFFSHGERFVSYGERFVSYGERFVSYGERFVSYGERFVSYGERCVAREGFPEMTPAEFVDFFCRSHKGCTPETEVTVIGFDYVAEVGDRVEVSPLVSGRPWAGQVECLTGSGDECKVVGEEGKASYLHQFAHAGFKVLPRVSNEDAKMVDKMPKW